MQTVKKLICMFLLITLVFSAAACADLGSDTGSGVEAASLNTPDKPSPEDDSIVFTPITDDTTAPPETTPPETTEPATETEEIIVTQLPEDTQPPETSDTTPPPETYPPQQDTQPPAYTGAYSSNPLIARMTFLGDSTTYGLKAYGIVDDRQVWTPANGTLAIFRATTDYIVDPATGAEYSIGDLCALRTPDILVITLGVNGISFLDESSFKMYYNQLIDTIRASSPSTKIALQTMYPLSASYDTSTGINNQKIAVGNQWIQQIAAAYGIPCINSASVLVDESGYRPEAWNNGDGLHMSYAGFSVVMDYIINNPCY